MYLIEGEKIIISPNSEATAHTHTHTQVGFRFQSPSPYAARRDRLLWLMLKSK
jgi:hypothetical protein